MYQTSISTKTTSKKRDRILGVIFLNRRNQTKLIKAIKIAIACCMSIMVCELLQLEYAASSVIVALLTIHDTRKSTFKLAYQRILAYLCGMFLACLAFWLFDLHWISFGFYILDIVYISYIFKWNDTISVNAVMGTHVLFSSGITTSFMMNELLIVIIGSFFAIVMNLIFPRKTYEYLIQNDINYIETMMQKVLYEMAMFLEHEKDELHLWDDLAALEKYLHKAVALAFENKDNVLQEHAKYYINYMNMRNEQANCLENIHFKLDHLKKFPRECKVIAQYLMYIIPYVKENNVPYNQKERFEVIKQEVLLELKEDFENCAILYGVVLDLEEFINLKVQFVNELDDEQIKIYWKLHPNHEKIS